MTGPDAPVGMVVIWECQIHKGLVFEVRGDDDFTYIENV